MHQERAPSYIDAPVLTGPTPTAGSGLTIQPQLAQAMKLRLLALCGCNKPRQSSQQHKPLLAASAAQTSAVNGILPGQEGAAAHAVYDSLRTTLPTALASTADSPVCL